MHSAIALQAAMYELLRGSSALVDGLGGEFVYDDVPDNASPPYLVFTDATHSDWSTSTERGTEHRITVSIWSAQAGRKEVLWLSGICQKTLAGIGSEIEGHALVNFNHEFTEVSRDRKSDMFRAKLHFRAVTEPLTQ